WSALVPSPTGAPPTTQAAQAMPGSGRPRSGEPAATRAPRKGGDRAVTSMRAWMEALVSAKGSDLHLKVGSPPRMRVDGHLAVLDGPILTPEMADNLLPELIRPALHDHFHR